MKQGRDRKELRRRKQRAYIKLAVGGVLFVPVVLVIVACLMRALAEWIVGGDNGDPIAHTVAMTAIWLGAAVAAAMLARWSLRTADQGYRDVFSATNTEEPAVAQSEVLLRAAQEGQETPKEELLRVDPEARDRQP